MRRIVYMEGKNGGMKNVEGTIVVEVAALLDDLDHRLHRQPVGALLPRKGYVIVQSMIVLFLERF